MRALMTLIASLFAGAALAQSDVKTADYDFGYHYPAQAARVPALRTWLEADRARLRSATAHDAAAARRDARSGGFPFRAYQASKDWKVVTETPRFLSLSADVASYYGGAHGQYGAEALVWDKQARRRLAPEAVFVSAAALQSALRAGWCAWLKTEREKRIGADGTGDDIFAKCLTIADLTVLLGSSDRRQIDRIGLIAAPYVAGSYAEGTYETTLPVTPAILRAVRPAYRNAFAVR